MGKKKWFVQGGELDGCILDGKFLKEALDRGQLNNSEIYLEGRRDTYRVGEYCGRPTIILCAEPEDQQNA